MMPLPDKGDIRRPLALAIRSTRLIGGVMILLTVVGAVSQLVSEPSVETFLMVAMMGSMVVAPGMLYLMCAVFMKKGEAWAVTLALVLACLQSALFLMIGVPPLGRGELRWQLIIIAAVLAALGQMIWHLSRSYPAVRAGGTSAYVGRGFEPVAVRPIEPGAQ